jgi:hypothetical protein
MRKIFILTLVPLFVVLAACGSGEKQKQPPQKIPEINFEY